MATYRTFQDIKTGIQNASSDDAIIILRSEQREAIDSAKERFCKKGGRKGDYDYNLLPEHRKFLWNAKMRFGKTICAMQLMREMDVKRTLIITHRPVVGDSWMEAFRQVVGTNKTAPVVQGNSDIHSTYSFGKRSDNESEGNFYDLEKFVQTEGNHYAFFISMQYIRLSELVNAKTQAKNQSRQDNSGQSAADRENEKLKADILNTDWDLIIIDEAHEGTRTSLGKSVIDDFLKKGKTKMLYLSGTPFNLYEDFDENEIYTWDYISEQQEKKNWNEKHPNEKNPYAELPKMNLYTYDIRNNFDTYRDEQGIFTFTEFFRTWTGNPKADCLKSDKNARPMPDGAKGRFVHEADVLKFLNLLCTKDSQNGFPFSTDENRKKFRHTFWVVSHVNEAAALEQLLKEHPIFKRFNIINVAGRNDSDEQNENALDKVLTAIGELPETTSTITISCGRLTTGVTVKPWTAVLYLKGGDRAASYMQTIFRVQSPYTSKDGKNTMKTECHVYDFAPDRTLKIVAETAKLSSITKTKKKKSQQVQDEQEDKPQSAHDKETVNKFIEFCPVISMDGGKMSPMNIETIYNQLENVFIDRLVRKGFDDPCLYVQEELNKIDPNIINNIGENGGQAPDEKRKDAKETIDLSHMTEEQRAEWEEKIRLNKAKAAEKAKKKADNDEAFRKQWESWSEEEREEWKSQEAERIARREKAKEEREEFRKRITNIRGIALRIPLLMYGGADAGDTKEDITVDNFTRKISDESWFEFMPKGISKSDFNKIKKCFNAHRFEAAGKKYRALTREADFMHVDERIRQITEIFSYFRNPDKETVLTPWRVVNMHMSDTIGGYCFYDETFDEKTGQLDTPRYVDQGDVTRQLFDNVDLKTKEVQTKILEINSKTGLYPLYVTYSLYRRRLKEYIKAECIDMENVSVQEEQVVWDDIVRDNIYVICNTPMAVGITRRTLFGFRDVERKANIKDVQLIKRASNDQEGLVKELKTVGFWKGNSSKQEMKFNAVVGNPPYQDSSKNNHNDSIYHIFIDIAYGKIAEFGTLITPGRFLFDAGDTPSEWNKRITSNKNIHVVYYTPNCEDIFPKVDIKGGIVITMYNSRQTSGPIGTFSIYPEISSIIHKLLSQGIKPLSDIVYSPATYKLSNQAFEQCQWLKEAVGKEKRFRTNIFEKAPNLFSDIAPDNTPVIGLWGLTNNKRFLKWVVEDFVSPNINLNKYKVVLPKANGSGMLGETLSSPIICKPKIGHTESFISIGAFENKEEAENVYKYICTRFARLMLGTLKVTQDNFPDTWANVPMQDFTSNSDIDWNKSIPEIDQQLYAKYGLDIFEIEFIEKMIKPME